MTKLWNWRMSYCKQNTAYPAKKIATSLLIIAFAVAIEKLADAQMSENY